MQRAPDVHDQDRELATVRSACQESSERSRERRLTRRANRAQRLRQGIAITAATALCAASGAVALGEISRMRGDDRRANQGLEPVSIRVDPQTSPTQRASAVEAARRFAEGRAGIVAFAMIDRSGNQVDRFGDRSFVSASVVKALLLVAELDRLERENLPLDPTTRSLLTQMITVSDNSAADAIYGRVGDGGLEAVARDARLKTFSVDGYWANAQITASDMARFADGLDAVLKGPHEKFGNGLLQNVVNWQRWGIPAAAGEAWRIRFKGGWRSTDLGALAHQIARLDGHGKHLSLAVLTDGQTSHEYATETVEGVAARLLAPLNRAR